MPRGRRLDAGTEPSRQLQIQRAFRKRQAERYVELEAKVARLEEENESLRILKKEKDNLERQQRDLKPRGRRLENVLDGKESPSSCPRCQVLENEKRLMLDCLNKVDGDIAGLSQYISSLRAQLQMAESSTSSSSSESESVETQLVGQRGPMPIANGLPTLTLNNESGVERPLANQPTDTNLQLTSPSLAAYFESINNQLGIHQTPLSQYPHSDSWDQMGHQSSTHTTPQSQAPQHERTDGSNCCLSIPNCKPQVDCPFPDLRR